MMLDWRLLRVLRVSLCGLESISRARCLSVYFLPPRTFFARKPRRRSASTRTLGYLSVPALAKLGLVLFSKCSLFARVLWLGERLQLCDRRRRRRESGWLPR